MSSSAPRGAPVGRRASAGRRARDRAIGGLVCVAALEVLAACEPPPARAAALPLPTTSEWRRARARLDALRREAAGSGPRTMRLSLRLREPFGGRVMEARGAVALAPEAWPRSANAASAAPEGGALRMILLGPGGTTALDLWTRGERFRFAVPALELERRGDASTPPSAKRGLPVDFLRWWLLRPAAGTLLYARHEAGVERFVLRDGAAIVDLRAFDGGRIEAQRTTWARLDDGGELVVSDERVEAEALGCAPVRYVTRIPLGGDGRKGLPFEISIACEGVETSRAPDPRAFVDPDAPAPSEASRRPGGAR
jgi:hypothetical protein